MQYYTIHNKLNGVNLVHPAYGTWNTANLEEAKDMLAACKEYVKAVGLEELIEQFVIFDLDTQTEIV